MLSYSEVNNMLIKLNINNKVKAGDLMQPIFGLILNIIIDKLLELESK